MRIRDAEYLKSATCRAEWPDSAGRLEVALCGRSNVGKSALLNTVLHRKGLARVSKTPGRTRMLNFFSIAAQGSSDTRLEWLLTDLPGFGYAEVGREERQRWRKMLEEYLSTRQSLRAVVMLFDARRVLDPRAETLLFDEMELVNYLRGLGRVVIPVITKADKLSKHERKPAAMALSRRVGRNVTIYSSLSGEGQDELLRRIFSALRHKDGGAKAESSEAELAEMGEAHESDSV